MFPYFYFSVVCRCHNCFAMLLNCVLSMIISCNLVLNTPMGQMMNKHLQKIPQNKKHANFTMLGKYMHNLKSILFNLGSILFSDFRIYKISHITKMYLKSIRVVP